MRSFFRVLCFFTLLSVPFSQVHAEQYLTIGAGWFDFNRSGDSSADFSGEWRGNPFFYNLRPVIGASANTDGGVYGYGGLAYDWEFTPRWFLTPGVAVGAWHDGGSIDLGGTLEFRESLELDYALENQYLLGAQINHTSNAGIYSHNPGVNSLLATFSIPLGN